MIRTTSCSYFLRHSLNSALDNAHDMGIHDLEQCIDHAIASVVYDILVGEPDGYPEGGYLEHHDHDDNPILFTRHDLLKVLPQQLQAFTRDTHTTTEGTT